MDYNLSLFSAFLCLPSYQPSERASSKPLFIFLLHHSIEKIIEVLNFPYYAQHQNVTWYWPESSLLSQKLPSSSDFNKKSHLSSYQQTPPNYTRHPSPTLFFPSFFSTFLLAPASAPYSPSPLFPQKQRGGKTNH